jgi:hypothetical protein
VWLTVQGKLLACTLPQAQVKMPQKPTLDTYINRWAGECFWQITCATAQCAQANYRFVANALPAAE